MFTTVFIELAAEIVKEPVAVLSALIKNTSNVFSDVLTLSVVIHVNSISLRVEASQQLSAQIKVVAEGDAVSRDKHQHV